MASSADKSSSPSRSGTKIVLSLLLVLIVSASLLIPRPAQALIAADIIGGISQVASFVYDKTRDALEWAWKNFGAQAYKNAFRTFTQQVAYNSAIMLTSGGQGQRPLVETRPFSQIVKDAADAAVGDFLDTLDTQNGFINLGLCSPTGPSAKLIIGYGIIDEIKPRRPRCTWSDIKNNWQEFFANPDDLLNRFGVAFDPNQHDLGVALHLSQTVIADKNIKADIAKQEASVNQGFKSITEPITGFIKTPAAQIKKVADVQLDLGLGEFGEYTGNALADALGVFTSTLASRLLKRLQEGTIPNPSKITSQQFGLSGGGVEYAIQINTSISTPQLVNATSVVDMIGELSVCPSDPGYFAPMTACTITQKFAQALRKAEEGTPLTVQEAIDQGFINGNLRFALVRTSDDLRAPTKAWYLSDIRKLRRARVVPLGWELAAEKFAGSNITLQQVIGSPRLNYTDGFNGTGPDGVCGTADDTGIVDGQNVCGLIDPNWILRVPPAQCRQEAYGQLLEPQGPNRQKTCVDLQHCVVEKADGTCLAWGYCTKEKNIWRLAGQSCEFPEGSGLSPWGTCQSFTDVSGRRVSYLISSLANFDDGVCSGAASCRWYSAARNPLATNPPRDIYLADGTQADVNTVDFRVQTPADARPRFYLKNLTKNSCSAQEEGCTRFLQLTNINTGALGLPDTASYVDQVQAAVAAVTDDDDTINNYEQIASVNTATLKQAPAYLNCYDVDKTNDSPECANYVQICSANEVGCELYTPRDGSPAVPGRVEATNVCPAECNGFNTYTQVSAFFENFLARSVPEPAINFIPATAQTCSAADAGCEEFTNVEQNERREYYSELRQCVRPEDNLHNTYYTWVGSDLTGYQLKTWQLRATDPSNPLSAPFTTDGSGDCRLPPQGSGQGGPDCKEFYATSGSQVAVHYRYESKVIYASANCNRYRATNITEADCAASNGTWEGGRCFYRAIPNQGKLCSAAAVGCREYRGPTAGNVRLVFPVSTFGDREPGVNADASPLSGWQGGTNSNESTSAFGHSLASGGDSVITKDISGLVTRGRQYTLTFWAKSDTGSPPPPPNTSLPLPLADLLFNPAAQAQNVTPVTFDLGTFTPTNEWSIHTLGPVTLDQDISSGVVLRLSGSQPFFVDNISFREIQDTFFVRKNSWRTPATCLEPQHLRCSAYTTRTGQTVYLTGFEAICRTEAVGCRALVDTRNSSVPYELTVAAGDQTVVVPADRVVFRVFDTKKTCAAKFAGCVRLGQPNYSSLGDIDGWSDIYAVLNPDTFDPIVNQGTSPLCSSQQNMCQVFTDAAGVTHYFKDPGSRLCEYKVVDSNLGYAWYKQGTTEPCNLVSNPSFEGLLSGTIGDDQPDTFVSWTQTTAGPNRLEAVASLNSLQYWGTAVLRLPAGAGVSNSSVILSSPDFSGDVYLAVYAQARLSSAVTAGGVTLNVDCGNCSAIDGGDFELRADADAKEVWHLLSRLVRVSIPDDGSTTVTISVASSANADVFIDNVQAVTLPAALSVQQATEVARVPYAYLCPSNYAGCTAYYEPALTKRAYWYINNSNLDTSSCNGQVSDKGGCVLFNQLSAAPLFNSSLTYADSRRNSNRLVSPNTTSPKDANVILKVQRDRTCGEWLACRSEQLKFNPQTGRFDSICYSLGRCNSVSSSPEAASARCGQWLPPESDPQPRNLSWYQAQPRQWDDPEYSGYTLANIYPLETLVEKDYAFTADDKRVCSNNPQRQCQTNADCPPRPTCSERRPVSGYCSLRSDIACSDDSLCIAKGAGVCEFTEYAYFCANDPSVRCETDEQCGPGPTCDLVTAAGVGDYRLTYVDNGVDRGIDGRGATAGSGLNTVPPSCRIYPQADAPFPSSVVREWKAICQNEDNAVCPSKYDPLYLEVPKDFAPGYSSANVCQFNAQTGTYENCDCSYQRLTYTNGETLFYGLMSNPQGAYVADVNLDGSRLISRPKKSEIAIGQKGYCLEKDLSRAINAGQDQACLTWYPTDTVQGQLSIYDYSPQAGLQGSAYYCTQAAGFSSYYQGLQSLSMTVGRNWPSSPTNGFDSCGQVAGGCLSCGDNGQQACLLNTPNFTASGAVDNDFGFTLSLNDLLINSGGVTAIEAVDVITYWLDNSQETIRLTRANPYGRVDHAVNEVYTQAWVNWSVSRPTEPFVRIGLVHTHAGATWFGTKVNLLLREMCLQTVQVARGVENKAWTDRVMRGGGYSVQPQASLGFNRERQPGLYGRALTLAPREPLIVADRTALVTTPQQTYMTITTPYGCSGSCGSTQLNTPPGRCIAGSAGKLGQLCVASSECEDNSGDSRGKGVCGGYFSGTCTGGAGDGQSCLTSADCGGGICGNYRSIVNQPNGRSNLQQLFAKEYGGYRWTGNKWDRAETYDDISRANGESPQVRQVIFDTSSNNLKPSGEGQPGRFVIIYNNRPYYAPLTIKSGEVVTVAFYAYNANGQQMPLREVWVNWGDNTTLSGAAGAYKNHKFRCKQPSDTDYNWGDDPKACLGEGGLEPAYFNYSHVYICTGTTPCSFRPKVMVKDNWEWCTNNRYQCSHTQLDGGQWIEGPTIEVTPIGATP